MTITNSQTKAKTNHKKRSHLKNKLEILEQYSILQNVKIEYKICKQEFNTLYDAISTGIKIRSRSEWYEFGKKKKIFLT